MALYGAPVWAEHLNAQTRALLRSPQRSMALRIIRGYRTISCEAALILARTPPWDLEARVLSEIYYRTVEFKQRGDRVSLELTTRWRRQARIIIMRTWEDRLATPTAGRAVAAAFRPHLETWITHCKGTLTFRMVQMFTGHGCFGHYLHCTARREPTTQCHHCDHGDDTAQHTLEDCPAWAEQRAVLCATIGYDLSLPAIVTAMVRSSQGYDAIADFCEAVISQKEAAEREREADVAADPVRRRRGGRRRAIHERQLPP
ncbi:uncharacterized protein LOC121735656 [Aricia agestis]|uniref:uncharacterized protein LOC121735656 n=1 Tax=Aricia agestis TaxID=91739 RepID=UPI001C207C70|nr:uncharacterized protein LOC121735656 [Aricia agestis]